MGLLTKDKLLAKSVLSIEKVELGEGSYVFVREMTGRERDAFEGLILKEVTVDGKTEYSRKMEDFRAKLSVATVCDEKGELLLGMDDYETLSMNMAASKLEKIVNVAQRLNKITEEDKDALVKNSEAGDTPGKRSASV